MTARRIAALAIILGVIGAIGGVFASAVTRSFLAKRWYKLPQNEMYPTIPAGSYLLVDPHPCESSDDVHRGDIIVFVRTENEAQYRFIWRVVALPGDLVEVAEQGVTINGKAVLRKLLRQHDGLAIFRETNGAASYEVAYPNAATSDGPPSATVTVPVDHFFVMGDNRYRARDSRYFGSVPFDSIIGRKVWSGP